MFDCLPFLATKKQNLLNFIQTLHNETPTKKDFQCRTYHPKKVSMIFTKKKDRN
jgi:hypothetical protein